MGILLTYNVYKNQKSNLCPLIIYFGRGRGGGSKEGERMNRRQGGKERKGLVPREQRRERDSGWESQIKCIIIGRNICFM